MSDDTKTKCAITHLKLATTDDAKDLLDLRTKLINWVKRKTKVATSKDGFILISWPDRSADISIASYNMNSMETNWISDVLKLHAHGEIDIIDD